MLGNQKQENISNQVLCRLRINNDVQYSFSLIKSIPLCLSWEVISPYCVREPIVTTAEMLVQIHAASKSVSGVLIGVTTVRLRTQEGVIWKRLIQYNLPDSHFQVSNISRCQPLWLRSADAYSCLVVCKWPLSVSMPHSLIDTLCWITAGAAWQAGCPACGYLLSCTHLFKGYCRSGFQCLSFTPSHVSFLLQSLFHRDRGPKALLLEYLYSSEHWLRWFYFSFDLLRVLKISLFWMGKLGICECSCTMQMGVIICFKW